MTRRGADRSDSSGHPGAYRIYGGDARDYRPPGSIVAVVPWGRGESVSVDPRGALAMTG